MKIGEFIASIDRAKLRKIDLNNYDDDNHCFNHKLGSHSLCINLFLNTGRDECDDLECYKCPLSTKAGTIKFLNQEETK